MQEYVCVIADAISGGIAVYLHYFILRTPHFPYLNTARI